MVTSNGNGNGNGKRLGLVAQWGGLASATFAGLGMLYSVLNFVQEIALDVRLTKVQIVQIVEFNKELQNKFSHDHDELIKLQTELERYIRERRPQ